MNDFYTDRLEAFARFTGTMEYVIRELGREKRDCLIVQAQEALEQLDSELAETMKDLDEPDNLIKAREIQA